MAFPERKTDVSKIPTALYLHGGPGLNSAVERTWFGERYPVLWWDQPRFPVDTENAYQATLDAAAEIMTELYARQGQPLHVIGWSFGARLALDLAHRAPETIGTLTLLAPSLCLETAFDRMAGHLATKGGIAAADSPAVRSDNQAGHHEDFMQRVISILSIPDLFSYYWAPTSGALFARHCTETAGTDWFDLNTFTAVSRDIIKRPIAPLPAGKINRIRIIAGRHDPYFDARTDIHLWQTIFPEASIRIEDGGHMLPFEVLAAEWMDSTSSAPLEADIKP